MNFTKHNKTAAVVATLFLTMIPAAAQRSSDLLAGLNVPAAKVDGPTSVEAKMEEGMPNLVWGETTLMGKITRKSRKADGFLVLTDGTRLEGQIALKCRFDKERTRWIFLEAEFREDKDQESRKIPASEIQDFDLTFTIAEFTQNGTKVSKDPAKNFHPAVVRLADGRELRGLAALHSQIGDGVPSGSGPRLYFAEDEKANLREFPARKLRGFKQMRGDGLFEFRSYNGALMPLLVNGKNLSLFQNPYPTSSATGFMAGLRGLGSDIAQDQLRQAAAKGAAKQDIERRIKNGEGLTQVVSGGAKAGADAAQQVDNAFSGIDLRGTKKEFVIRNVRTGAEVIVNDDTMAENLAPLMAACPATAAMKKKDQKEMLKFKELEKVVRTLDECF